MLRKNDMFWRMFAAATVVGGSLVALGCTSRITGNEGELEFSYITDDLSSDFNKPIAVGANLEVRVRTAGEGGNVDIQEVFTDEDVLIVDSFSGDDFILSGVGEGNSLVEVVAEGPAGEVSDSVNMRAAIPEVLRLSHSCTGEETGLYPVGKSDVLVSFDLALDDGTDVIGYGFYPVSAASGLGTIDEAADDQANIHLDLGPTPGEYVLSSTIDDTTLTFRLVEDAEITAATLNDDTLDIRVNEGTTSFIYVWPAVGDKIICQATAEMTVASLTPGICDVRNSDTPEDVETVSNPEGYVAIEAISAGECRFEVTFPAGNAGAGATTEFTAQVDTAPGDDGTM